MTFPVANWQLLEARVDYWSGTTDDPELGAWAYERAREYVENDRLGDFSHSGQNQQGYTGVASDHTFTGQREGSTYVRFSSLDASYRWLEFVGAGLRSSRIDLCVTCTAGRDVPNVAYSVRYDQRLPHRIRGQQARVVLLSDSNAGDTAYIGSPRTIRRGRLYDKARESPGAYPLGAWRWEMQSRHAAAETDGLALASRESDERWLAAHVRGWFLDRGIPAPWDGIPDYKRPIMPAPTTTDAKRLEWLKTSVRPMVHRMKARYSLHELRSALGLLYDVSETTRTRITREH